MLFDGFDGVVAAGGVKSASGSSEEGPDEGLEGVDQKREKALHRTPKTSLKREITTSKTIKRIMVISSLLECW
jgi:hypothetical protein